MTREDDADLIRDARVGAPRGNSMAGAGSVMIESEASKPAVRLVGEDGNAFAILGRCQKAARRAGWSRERIDAFMKEATSGDYDHLLQTCCVHFEVE